MGRCLIPDMLVFLTVTDSLLFLPAWLLFIVSNALGEDTVKEHEGTAKEVIIDIPNLGENLGNLVFLVVEKIPI